MITRRTVTKGALAAMGAAHFPSTICAQETDYPNRPLRAICMFPPGSGADISVRFLAAKLARLANQNVIVENRVGANGNLANEYVARSKPDGYTIYIAPASSVLAPAPHLFKKINFDPLNDFEHITTIYSTQFLLCVDGASPFKTLADLTRFLKQQGDKASYGSTANTGVIASEFYKAAFDLKTVEVKYKVSQTTYNDLSSGALAFAHLDFRGNAGAIRDGRVRALATSSDKRMRAMPDVPSAQEAGIKEFITAWWSVHTAAKIPEPVIAPLESWFGEIVNDPETEKFLVTSGAEPLPGNRKLVRDMLVRDLEAWGRWVKIANIEPQ